MDRQTIKTQIINNIMVAVATHLNKVTLHILHRIIAKEFVNVNMEEITTLPMEYQNNTDQRNKYISEINKS